MCPGTCISSSTFHSYNVLSKFIFRFPFYICKTLYLSALKKLQFKNKKQTFFTYIIHWSNSPKAPHLGLILKIQLSIKVDNSKNVLYISLLNTDLLFLIWVFPEVLSLLLYLFLLQSELFPGRKIIQNIWIA